MPTLPQVAKLSQAVTLSWTSGALFNGFLLIGLVVPTSAGTGWAEVDVTGQAPGERIPMWTKVAVVDGKFDNTVGVIYTTSLNPPNTQYVCWYYDQSVFPPKQIAGPSTFFQVTSDLLTPPSLTLTAPTLGVVAPTPDS